MSLNSFEMQELARKQTSLTKDQFDAVFSGWAFHEYGAAMGVALVKGSEFHFLPTSAFTFNRAVMRNQIKPLLDVCGFLTTRVEHSDKKSQKLNRIFGFKPTWSDDKFQYSILTALPFKEKTCQS